MVFAVAGGGQLDTGAYTIDNSIRFNDGDSPDLSRTNVASPTNSKKYTYSVWIKRGVFSDGENRQILSAINGNNRTQILFRSGSNEAIRVLSTNDAFSTFKYLITTNALYRDASAWYHVVCVFDSTNATANDRFKIYVNGVEQSLSISTSVASNYDDPINSGSVAQDLGSANGSEFFDGYFAEAHFIDGQALDPTDFGEFDEDSGIWKPIRYTGSYGTNGFYLNFKNSGSLGADQSGNGNNFTPTNLASTDQVIDTPTNNFCVASPLLLYDTAQFSQGNLRITQSSNNADGIRGTIGVKTGKWYWEIYNGGGNSSPGIATESATTKNYIGSDSYGWSYFRDGKKYTNDSASTYGASFTTGDVIGVALDMDNNQVTFYKNNSSQGVAFTGLPDEHMFPGISTSNTLSVTNIANFGQDSSFAGSKTRQNNSDGNGYGDFYYTPPSGFLALCTQNLATELSPTIDDGSAYFHTQLYTGNNNTGQSITNDANAGDFQPDFLWLKDRSDVFNHYLTNSSRGNTKYLNSNGTGSEFTNSNIITSFDSDGFTTGTDNAVNYLTDQYVVWQWKCNAGSTSSNTDGSITSTVQANTEAGFSIVTYTGNATNNATVGHGLGKTPKIVIVKATSVGYNWVYFTTAIDGTLDYMFFNRGDQKRDLSQNLPTSSVFSLFAGAFANGSGYPYLAYCFAEIEGYSKFGNFAGNGSTDGPFVYTGFRPAFVIIKVSIGGTENWSTWDTSRDTFNVTSKRLQGNTSGAESSASFTEIDILSNGFKPRTTTTTTNGSGYQYVYMAFAENPFVTSTGIPVTAR